jgi:hypothetical protein
MSKRKVLHNVKAVTHLKTLGLHMTRERSYNVKACDPPEDPGFTHEQEKSPTMLKPVTNLKTLGLHISKRKVLQC